MSWAWPGHRRWDSSVAFCWWRYPREQGADCGCDLLHACSFTSTAGVLVSSGSVETRSLLTWNPSSMVHGCPMVHSCSRLAGTHWYVRVFQEDVCSDQQGQLSGRSTRLATRRGKTNSWTQFLAETKTVTWIIGLWDVPCSIRRWKKQKWQKWRLTKYAGAWWISSLNDCSHAS